MSDLSRRYSLGMGAINLAGTLSLFALSRVNALHDWPNVVVSVCGPVSTLVFGLIAIAWFLDALRPGVFRRYLPGSSERWMARMATSWAETRERRLTAAGTSRGGRGHWLTQRVGRGLAMEKRRHAMAQARSQRDKGSRPRPFGTRRRAAV